MNWELKTASTGSKITLILIIFLFPYSEYEFPYDTSWELDRDKIKILDDTLGEGAFGLVKKAKYQGRTVAVKMLKEGI